MHVLLHAGIENINSIVETLPMDDAHVAICKLREHLEHKARHTRPYEDEDFEDLLGL